MPDDTTLKDPMTLILVELKSLNRTVRMLASHLMDMAEGSPGTAVGRGMIPAMNDELPEALPDPLIKRLRAMEPDRREHLLGELRRAWNGH
jgi:hypothetical protein